MDSYLSGYSHNLAAQNQQMPQHGVVHTSGSTASSGAPVQEADISQLKAGDTFKGEIVSVNGEDVQILLINGQYMAAKLERDVQVALGQILNLQVKSNKDNKIVLKPIMDGNAQMMRVGTFALKSANLAVNEKNLELVSKLIENGMSIDKNTLMTFNRLALQHPDADMASIIKLVKLQIPVTENNLTQYENYQNFEHRILDGINETSDEIIRLYDTLVGNGGADFAGTIGSTMPEMAVKYMEQVINLLTEDENTQNIQAAPQELHQDAAAQTLPDSNVQPQPPIPSVPAQAADDIQKTAVNTEMRQDAPTQQAVVQNQTPHLTDKEIKQLEQTDARELPDKIISLVRDGKANIQDIKQIKNLTPEMKYEIFSSEPFKALVRNTLQRQWTLSPKELAQDGKLQEFYEKLERQSSRLSQIMNETADAASQQGGVESQTRAAANIRDNVEFINQMNQMYNYIQLPLKLTNSQAHGDLYVYTNKRSLAKREGVLTAFLHLDMDNLGGVDVSISLQTEKNEVMTKFYLEEDALSLLEEHIDELTQRLTKKGYNCKHMIQQRDEEKTVMQRIEEQVAGKSAALSYQTFDIRT